MSFYRRWGKRWFDMLCVAPALIVAALPLAVVALLVRWRLGSPVLFRQPRVGLGNRPFPVLKFRTMTDERDERGELLPDEVRLTRFGKFLRSASLDELPQLISVLKGDMSLVGPRPLHTRYLPRYSPTQLRRHEVRPGVTGLAQIRGRNSLSWDEKFALDVEYVDRCSWGLDLKILLLTVWKVISRDGISQDGSATMPEFWGAEQPPAKVSS